MEPSITEAIRVITKLESLEDVKEYIGEMHKYPNDVMLGSNERIWATASKVLEKELAKNNPQLKDVKKALVKSLKIDSQILDENFLTAGGTRQELDRLSILEKRGAVFVPRPPQQKRDQSEQRTGRKINTEEDKALVDELSKLIEKTPENWKGSNSVSDMAMKDLKFLVKEYKGGKYLDESAEAIDIALDVATMRNTGIYRTPADKLPFTPIEMKLNEIKQKITKVNERQGEEADVKAGKPDRRGQHWER